MAMYLGIVDRRSSYYCKNCRTTLKSILVNVGVGEYDKMPEKNEIIQSKTIPKSHTLKDIVMIVPS